MLSDQRMSVALCSEVVQAGVCPSIVLHREPQRPDRGRSVRFLGIFSESSRNFLGTVYLIFASRTGAVLGSGRKSVMPFEYSVSREPQLPTPRAFRSFSGNFLGIFRLRAASSPLFFFFVLSTAASVVSQGSALKGRIQVTFTNQHGVEEAGIDGGGVFKEYMDLLTKRAFDPQYALFLATEDQVRAVRISCLLSLAWRV